MSGRYHHTAPTVMGAGTLTGLTPNAPFNGQLRLAPETTPEISYSYEPELERGEKGERGPGHNAEVAGLHYEQTSSQTFGSGGGGGGESRGGQSGGGGSWGGGGRSGGGGGGGRSGGGGGGGYHQAGPHRDPRPGTAPVHTAGGARTWHPRPGSPASAAELAGSWRATSARSGRAVQADSINPRVKSAYGFRA